jgi:hypothetical protein
MEERQPERLPYKQNADVRVLDDKRRSVRPNAANQFSKQRSARRSGIKRCSRERNFRWREDRKLGEPKIDMRKVANCGRKIFCGGRSNGTKNFTTGGSDRLWLGVCGFGMERTSVLRRLRSRCDRAERAVIRNREPGTDRHRNDQATRTCSHGHLIADATRMLKCFLPLR